MNAEKNVYSVKELSDILKSCFENPYFKNISVYGEIYSLKLSSRFAYLEIGDQGQKQTTSPLLKVAFSLFYGADYHMEDYKIGDVVQVKGSLSYYPHGSSVTLWATQISLLQSQQGKTLLLKQKTLEKLDKLGYLDKKTKKQLPVFCRKVGIVTAVDGAAYQDILKTLHDRFPVDTVLFPCQVQGKSAASSITKAILKASEYDLDCLIIGRGGGSKTDLSCFDDEKVCLAIATCKVPTITCIGHTIDIAIADRVSDYRAITPTEAASLINPSLEDIHTFRNDIYSKLKSALENIVYDKEQQLSFFYEKIKHLSPDNKIKKQREKLTIYLNKFEVLRKQIIFKYQSVYKDLLLKINNIWSNKLLNCRLQLDSYIKRINMLNPANNKVKSQIYLNGKLVESIEQLKKSDTVKLVFKDGEAISEIKEVHHG